MVEAGVALVIVGAALLVAEAHVPEPCWESSAVWHWPRAGADGRGRGAGIAVVIASVLAAAAVAGLWLGVATRKALATRRLRHLLRQ